MENLLIYGSIFDMLDELSNEEAGLLFKALNSFRKGEEVEFEDRYLKGIWKGIKPNLDKLKENYDSKVKANQENGKKGGRPKKSNDATSVASNTQTENKTTEATLPTQSIPEYQEEEKVSEIEANSIRQEIIPILKQRANKYFKNRYNDKHFDSQITDMIEMLEDIYQVKYVDELTDDIIDRLQIELGEPKAFYKVSLFEKQKELITI
jgi:hypothetical protein